MSKRIDRDALEAALDTNDKALLEGLEVVYENQLDFEKQVKTSVERNYVGFNKQDARRYSNMAQEVREGKALSAEQLSFLRSRGPSGGKRLKKYVRQIAEAVMSGTPGKVSELRRLLNVTDSH